jgi:hypothetical protein
VSALVLMILLQVPDGGVSSHPLEGVWQLDLEKSTDTGPILEKLGVNWFVRRAAKSVRPIHRIRVNSGTLFVEIDASISKKRYQLVLDGATATKDEFFGDELSYTTVLDNGVFRSTGRMTDPSKKMGMSLMRQLTDDGLMLYRITLSPDGQEPMVIDRVFRRKP